MSDQGIVLYDLVPQCPECTRPTANRMLLTAPTGCATCDEVITRHRCTRCPPLSSLVLGQSWACPECDSTWTAVEEDDSCGECGQPVKRKAWSVEVGARIGSAPRYTPAVFTPYRDLARKVLELAGPPACSPWDRINAPARPEACYRARAGFTVHVRPGCRCPR